MATLMTCFMFVVALQFHVVSPQIEGRTIAGRYNCCGANLMDSSRHVLIQKDYELVQGTFLAVKIQFCTNDGIYLQIWRPFGNSYKLKWQIYYEPTVSTYTAPMTVLNFRDKPLTLEAGDRLGLYSRNLSKIAVPYLFDVTKFVLYRSAKDYSEGHVFSLNDQVELGLLKWPRSFKPFVVFCSQEECPLFAHDDVGVVRDISGVGPAGPPGPPGPEGPPGPAPTANPFPVVQCDAPDLSGVNTALSELKHRNVQMQQKVDEMTEILRGLSTSTKVTGICPSGFSAGWYGVGKCYLIIRDRMAAFSAHIHCRTFKAQLVAIETKSENDYLARTIYERGPKESETFWTSGMYRYATKQWVWHDEITRMKAQLDFSSWDQGQPPVNASASGKICLTMTVGNKDSVFSTWKGDVCQTKHYFICEIPKQCL